MNKEEMSWLLETINDPENAKRFVLAQYERGRISFQVMADVAPEPNWAYRTANRLLTTATEHSTTEFPIAFAW